MADAFISYSRRDKEFVHRLQETLAEQQREAWLDTKDIPPTAEWLQEIYAAIERSDAFVFVISADSTLSEVCQLELAHAVKHHKRLIPILRREADQCQVPEPLPQLNWLNFQEGEDFQGAFQTFLTALTTDLDHVRAHTRLLTQARDWEGKGRDRSLLLRGGELKESETWLAGGGDKEPRPTDLMQQFLLASRQGAVRRRRLLLGSVGFALLVAIILSLAAFSQYRVAQRRDRIARSRQLAALANKLPEDKLDLALLLSVEACRAEETIEARSALLTALGKEPYLKTMLHGHIRYIKNVAFSPDGKTLASLGFEDTIILWDLHTYQAIGELQGDWSLSHLAFSPDGKILASGSEKTIILWDLKNRKPLGPPLTGHQDAVVNVAFSPDGRILASAGSDNTIILWDLKTRRPLLPPLKGHPGADYRFAFSPDGKILAWANADKTITLWDLKTQRPLGPPLAGHQGEVYDLAFSPVGKILASASFDKTIILWDLKTQKPLGPPLTGHQDKVHLLAFSPDGRILASAGSDNTIILWDMKTRKPLGPPLTGHQPEISRLAFSPDGQILASAGNGIILWDLKTSQPLGKIAAGENSFNWSPDGQMLASGTRVPLKLWDVKAVRAPGHRLIGQQKQISKVACSPDGKIFASADYDGIIILWDLKTRKRLGPPLTGHQGAVYGLAFSPDGQILASAGRDKTIILWDLKTRKPLAPPLTGQKDMVSSLAFSPDGRLLVSGGREVILWDLNTKKPLSPPLKELYGYPAFSPDGHTLAVSGYETILWDLKTSQPLGPPLEKDVGHPNELTFSPTGQIFARLYTSRGRAWFALWDLKTRKAQLGPENDNIGSVAFSPDGHILASGGDGIIFWDMTQPLGSPPGGDKIEVNSIAFTPDGQTLVSGNQDGSLRFWDGSLQSWVRRACRVANRNLTHKEWQEYFGDKPYRRTFANLPEGEKD